MALFVTNSDAYNPIFAAFGDNYPRYRIPSIVRSANGTLLAFVEGRQTVDDNGYKRVAMKTSSNDGLTWGDEITLLEKADESQTCGGWAIGNPTPAAHQSGRVWLLMSAYPGDIAEGDLQISENKLLTAAPYAIYTDDDGVTWKGAAGTALDLPIDPTVDGVDLFGIKPEVFAWFGPGPTTGIEADDGNLYFPMYGRTDGKPRGCVFKLDTTTGTWSAGDLTDSDTRCGEPTLAQMSDGTFMMNVRTTATVEKRRRVFLSSDRGQTWDSHYLDDTLVSPGCQGSLLRVNDRLYFTNPACTNYSNSDTLTQADPATSLAPFEAASTVICHGTWDGATVTVSQGAATLATFAEDQQWPFPIVVNAEQDVTFEAAGAGPETSLSVGIGDRWWAGNYVRIRPTVRLSLDDGESWPQSWSLWPDTRTSTDFITGDPIGAEASWPNRAEYSGLVTLPGGILGMVLEARTPITVDASRNYIAITFLRLSLPTA